MGQGRQQHGCPILCRSKIRAISRVFVAIHGKVLLLAAYYGAHVGEMALVPYALAMARLLWISPCPSWWGVKAHGLA